MISHFWKEMFMIPNKIWRHDNYAIFSSLSFLYAIRNKRAVKIKWENDQYQNQLNRASLVAQWLRIHLPMQGTRVRALVREDPTCLGATGPVCHNYWACALEPASHNYWACEPQLLKPACLEPVLCNGRGHRSERPMCCREEWPPLAATGESPHTATGTQHSQK